MSMNFPLLYHFPQQNLNLAAGMARQHLAEFFHSGANSMVVVNVLYQEGLICKGRGQIFHFDNLASTHESRV